MPIEFSNHAKRQLKLRNIPEKKVIQVVENSDKAIQSFRGRKLRQAKVGDKILEVVTRSEGSRITIITAYFLEE